MKKLISIILIVLLLLWKAQALMNELERWVFIEWNLCQNIQEQDIPTILIPGILASWYSEEWYKETGNNIKRWIPDPITHAYDTLIYTFKQNWYSIRDVFYKDQFTLSIDWYNPKWWLYVFGYDWKKDNKITATLLTQLVWLILKDYEIHNKCNIWKVNIVAHSMWWLVARAMLEDMCVTYWKDDKYWNKIIQDYSNDVKNWKIQNFDSYPCNNPYSSSTISKEIKVNKLVTIATPQRWSPKTFPIWEKGDIEMTDWFVQWIALKNQLDVSTDLWLYKLIHWYDTKVPNWIVTIWQLLPDIKNNNDYNNTELKYLYNEKSTNNNIDSLYNTDSNPYSYLNESTKNFYDIKKENYPQNSFLEELNKKENIEKMFKKIEKKYFLYYSTITWNNWLNNVFNLELGNITLYNTSILWPVTTQTIYDETDKHKGQDIYDKYQSNTWKNYYLINKLIRNQSGLWWDWTVPTNNLKLIPNDSIDWNEIDDPKFDSIEIKCNINPTKSVNYKTTYTTDTYISEKIWNWSFSEWNILQKEEPLSNEKYPYNWFWEFDKYEVCSHSNMPFATSSQVLESILDKKDSFYEKRYNLISNFWYADYTYQEKQIFSNRWIKNNAILSWLFDDMKYKKSIPQDLALRDNVWYPIRFSLDLQTADALVEYDILSPIDILITDELWRRIWIDRDTGMIINEIPGAWTSWRAGESGEREFFLIPAKKWEKIDHKIETNSTWDWEYHIVMSAYDNKWNTTNSGVIIAWNAKLGFNENYELIATSTGSNYIDVNANLPLTLEVTKEFKTNEDKIDIRYNVKWQGRENVEKIRYKLEQNPPNPLDKGGLAQNWEKSINWILEIPLKEAWNYELTLELLDKDDKVLKTETVKIQKWEIEKEVKTIKNVLNAMFYKNIDLNLYNIGSWVIKTNYQFKVDADQNRQNISIIKPNWEIVKFSIEKDFKYKSDKNNWLEILEVNSNNIIFKEIIPDLEIEKIYNYSFIQNRIEKVEIIKWENTQKITIIYDINWNIKEIVSDDNILKFEYDDYTWKLVNISDLYENKIEFSYDNDELWWIKINNELISSNLNLVRLDYKTLFNLKHKNKLQKIKSKLESEKIDNKKKQKIIKSLEKSKAKYLKLSKLDVTKKEIEYLVEEIKKILENL